VRKAIKDMKVPDMVLAKDLSAAALAAKRDNGKR